MRKKSGAWEMKPIDDFNEFLTSKPNRSQQKRAPPISLSVPLRYRSTFTAKVILQAKPVIEDNVYLVHFSSEPQPDLAN